MAREKETPDYDDWLSRLAPETRRYHLRDHERQFIKQARDRRDEARAWRQTARMYTTISPVDCERRAREAFAKAREALAGAKACGRRLLALREMERRDMA